MRILSFTPLLLQAAVKKPSLFQFCPYGYFFIAALHGKKYSADLIDIQLLKFYIFRMLQQRCIP